MLNDDYGIIHKGVPQHIRGQMVEFSKVNEANIQISKPALKKLQAAARKKGSKVILGTKKNPLSVRLPDGTIMEPTRSGAAKIIHGAFRGAGTGALAGAAIGAGGGLGVQHHIAGVVAGKIPKSQLSKSTALIRRDPNMPAPRPPATLGKTAMTKSWAAVTGASVGAATGGAVGFVAGGVKAAVAHFRKTGKVPPPVTVRKARPLEKQINKLDKNQRALISAVGTMSAVYAVTIGIPQLINYIAAKSPSVTAYTDMHTLGNTVVKKHNGMVRDLDRLNRDLQRKSGAYRGNNDKLRDELEAMVAKKTKLEGLLKRTAKLNETVKKRLAAIEKSGGIASMLIQKQRERQLRYGGMSPEDMVRKAADNIRNHQRRGGF